MSGHFKKQLLIAQPGPSKFDAAVLRYWPQTLKSSLIDATAVLLTRAGEASTVWFVLCVGAFLSSRLSTRQALLGICGIIVEWIVSNRVAKGLLWRPRPEPNPSDPRWLRRPTSSSLPSGHSSAGAFATVYVGGMSHWFLPLGILAFLIGLSRIHLRVHYPTDVLAGWTLGALLGAIALAVS